MTYSVAVGLNGRAATRIPGTRITGLVQPRQRKGGELLARPLLPSRDRSRSFICGNSSSVKRRRGAPKTASRRGASGRAFKSNHVPHRRWLPCLALPATFLEASQLPGRFNQACFVLSDLSFSPSYPANDLCPTVLAGTAPLAAHQLLPILDPQRLSVLVLHHHRADHAHALAKTHVPLDGE